MTRLLALAAAPFLFMIVSAPANAQFSDSYNFLKGVRDRDGEKVTAVIAKPGSVIIDTRDPSTGESALHIVTKGRDTVWLAFLLGKGAKPNVRDNQGNTPLMIATQLGYAEGISLLLERGAQVDLPDNAGETPLIRAVQNRDAATVRILLAAGADPNRADRSSGLTAREYAVRDQRSAAIVKAIDDARPHRKASIGPN